MVNINESLLFRQNLEICYYFNLLTYYRSLQSQHFLDNLPTFNPENFSKFQPSSRMVRE